MKPGIGVLSLAFFLFCVLCGSAQAQPHLTAAGIADGPGIWINMWHYPEGDLDVYCSKLSAHGIRNIFIQTSRTNTPAITNPDGLAAVIEACHRHKIRVIAWSFAELLAPVADADKMIAAAHFQTPNGERLDGIAPNLEQNLDSWRVEAYSQHLRKELGTHYPLIAVVFSPLNRAPQVAKTPWKVLAHYYDVIAPMAYWGGKHQKLDAYTYTLMTVQKVRQLVGKSNVEIHVIGDGMGTNPQDLHQFMKACKDAEAASASLYPNHRPTPEQLVAISRYSDHFPSNSRFRLAAFREMTRSGALCEPPNSDPSQLIPRGELYRMIGRQLLALRPAKPAGGKDGRSVPVTQVEALQALINAGLVAEIPESVAVDSVLAAPVSSREALSLIAAVVEQDALARAGVRKAPDFRKHPPSRWFALPAMAESQPPTLGDVRLVSYMEAAQMVLEARAGLR